MANTITEGKDLHVFVDGTSIAMATSHSLSVSAETATVTHKDITGGWDDASVKKFSWTASSENLFCDDAAGKGYDDLYALMIAKTPVTLVFGHASGTTFPETGWTPQTTGSNLKLTGQAIITKLDINAPADDNATFTVEFTGKGQLVKA